jgi:hypothetical protein
MRVLLPALLVIAALVYWEARRELALDHRLSAIESTLAGRPVKVDCPGFLRSLVDTRGNSGSVEFGADGRPGNTTHLESSVCGDLSAYAKTRKRADFACIYGAERCSEKVERAVTAVLVLSHEAQHLRGIRDEATAQCYAIQRMPLAAERLGSPPAEARAIAVHFLEVDQPLVPSEYALPAECRDGGGLDLDPDSPDWP